MHIGSLHVNITHAHMLLQSQISEKPEEMGRRDDPMAKQWSFRHEAFRAKTEITLKQWSNKQFDQIPEI